MMRKTILASLALSTLGLSAPGMAQRVMPGNLDAVQAGPIKGDVGVPRGGINVCCPPIAKQDFAPFFRVQQSPGKNITQTYGLDFLPTAALDTQMKAYAPFAGLFAPSGYPNSVLLDAEMRKMPGTATPTPSSFSGGTPVHQHAMRGWWTTSPSNVWNGPATTHTPFPSHVWEKEFNDNLHPSSTGNMQPNTWYMIKLTLKLAWKDRPNDDSWNVSNINCMERYVAVRVNAVSYKSSAGVTAPAAAEIVDLK
ncbi:MAG: hypothetical protein ACKOPQ_07130 [Novosphingobium sp.]